LRFAISDSARRSSPGQLVAPSNNDFVDSRGNQARWRGESTPAKDLPKAAIGLQRPADRPVPTLSEPTVVDPPRGVLDVRFA
jgi:hypothetical protein